MDMMWAFMGHYYGFEAANATVNGIEYTPHTDPHWDAFAVVHDVSDRAWWVELNSLTIGLGSGCG